MFSCNFEGFGPYRKWVVWVGSIMTPCPRLCRVSAMTLVYDCMILVFFQSPYAHWPLFFCVDTWSFQLVLKSCFRFGVVIFPIFPATGLIIHFTEQHTIFQLWNFTQIFWNFHPYLGKISNLTNIFQMGWDHQLAIFWVSLKSHGHNTLLRFFSETRLAYRRLTF